MEKKKNIISITGVDTYGVRKEKEQWKKIFREKYGSENIEEVRIEEVKDWSRIEQDMQSMGLFATRRLWCFSGGFAKSKKEEWETTKKKKWDWIEEKIIHLCESIGDDHFMIFSGLFFDPEKWTLIPWLEKHADTRKSNTLWNVEVWEKRFRDLDSKVIQKVLNAYKEAETWKEESSRIIADSIGWTLEKLSLLWSKKLNDEDIEMSLNREYGGKMFDLSDAILTGNGARIKSLLERMPKLLPRTRSSRAWSAYSDDPSMWSISSRSGKRSVKYEILSPSIPMYSGKHLIRKFLIYKWVSSIKNSSIRI